MGRLRKTQVGGLFLIFAILGFTFVAGSTLQLGIATIELTIRVLDKSNNSPIGGALVEFDMLGPWEHEGDVDYTVTTDNSGIAKRGIPQAVYNIRVTKYGYKETYREDVDLRLDSEHGSKTLTFTLERDTNPPPSIGETVTFYLVDSNKNRIPQAEVSLDDKKTITDQDGMARFHSVPTKTYTVRFKGRIQVAMLKFEVFEFTSSVKVSTSTPLYDPNVFTVWVETETIENASPPKVPSPETPDPVAAYLPYIFIAFGIVGVGILFWGQGPELIRMATRKQ